MHINTKPEFATQPRELDQSTEMHCPLQLLVINALTLVV